jgi:UDP-N-acetylglucosamine 2-epimerase (non-hydrolysing)/GDP/UDP-N,N'-diacetylbacillosamine 2-epimerase (hydrolysing)
LDAVHLLDPLTREELESHLAFGLRRPMAVVTYHPVTLEPRAALTQVENLLAALKQEHIRALFTKANADAQGRAINQRIAEFCTGDPTDYVLCDSLGQQAYFSCLKHMDLMIGNSSSGLIEAPSFELPVVNIGNRQKGRIRAANVIDVGYGTTDIVAGIRQACSPVWRAGLRGMANPYAGREAGRTSVHIKEELKRVEIGDSLLAKVFYDMPAGSARLPQPDGVPE